MSQTGPSLASPAQCCSIASQVARPTLPAASRFATPGPASPRDARLAGWVVVQDRYICGRCKEGLVGTTKCCKVFKTGRG